MKRETLIQNAVCNNLIAAADLVQSECEQKLQESKHCLNCVYFIERKNGSTACLYKIMQEAFGFMISHGLLFHGENAFSADAQIEMRIYPDK